MRVSLYTLIVVICSFSFLWFHCSLKTPLHDSCISFLWSLLCTTCPPPDETPSFFLLRTLKTGQTNSMSQCFNQHNAAKTVCEQQPSNIIFSSHSLSSYAKHATTSFLFPAGFESRLSQLAAHTVCECLCGLYIERMTAG